MRKDKVSLKQISESLDVSVTLVSMVLNNKGDDNGINKETQKRVWAKANELNYKPNPLLRTLRVGKTFTLGLVVSDISNPFYSKIARFMEVEAAKRGYTLLICSTDESPEKEQKLIKMLVDRCVDGIVVSTSQSSPEQFLSLQERKIPHVFIDRYFDGVDTSSVVVDNCLGAYQAVEHLVQQGCRKIAAFAVTPIYVSSTRLRIDGFINAMRDLTEYDPYELLVEVDYQEMQRYVQNRIEELCSSSEPIDAIFAVNNQVAMACISSIAELGLAIPKDIAIISFDDIEAFRLLTPKISSVSQPLEEIGRMTIDLLVDEIEAQFGSIHRNFTLFPALIVRESTDKCNNLTSIQ